MDGITPLRERGKLRANPQANWDNVMHLASCPCVPGSPCEDVITITNGSSAPSAITGVVFNGEALLFADVKDFDGVQLIGNTVQSDNISALQDALWKTIGRYEVDPYLKVEVSGNDVVFTHQGVGEVESVTASSGGPFTNTRYCDIITNCDYTFKSSNITPGNLSNDGGTTNQALANAPYTHTGTKATDDATAVELQTDMGTALTTLGETVISTTVTNDEDAGVFVIVVKALSGKTYSIDGTDFIQSNCQDDYDRS